MAKQLEREIQTDICYWLHYQRIPFLVFDNKGSFDPDRGKFRRNTLFKIKGVSDLIVWRPKTLETLFVEVKAPKGRMSQSQKDFQTWAENLGFKYFIVKSIEDMERIIKYD